LKWLVEQHRRLPSEGRRSTDADDGTHGTSPRVEHPHAGGRDRLIMPSSAGWVPATPSHVYRDGLCGGVTLADEGAGRGTDQCDDGTDDDRHVESRHERSVTGRGDLLVDMRRHSDPIRGEPLADSTGAGQYPMRGRRGNAGGSQLGGENAGRTAGDNGPEH